MKIRTAIQKQHPILQHPTEQAKRARKVNRFAEPEVIKGRTVSVDGFDYNYRMRAISI